MAATGAMNPIAAAALQIAEDLRALGRSAAVVGGIAVSARSEPRFTRDLDLAVTVSDDTDAEALVFALRNGGYSVDAVLEQTALHRMSTVRLQSQAPGARGVVVDLLFASSGIEPEIVAAAEALEVLPGVTLPVARVGHLLALKVLARDDRRRPQDLADIRALLAVATPEELERAATAVRLIQQRGFSRGRDLRRRLATLVREHSRRG